MKKGRIFIILCLMTLISMGCSQEKSVQNDNVIIDSYEKNTAEEMAEQDNQIESDAGMHAFYYADAILCLGINKDDGYESVISKLRRPYHENSESTPPSLVCLLENKTYAEIFFNGETGKVSYISYYKEE